MTKFLDRQLQESYVHFTEDAKHKQKKLDLRQKIYSIISKHYPVDLYVVGSTVTGLSRWQSDLDMCLMFRDYHDDVIDQRRSTELLEKVKKLLSAERFGHFSNFELIPAKVVLLQFNDNQSKIKIQLNVGNRCGIRNTHLIKFYVDLDPRVAKVVIAVKRWAQANDINSAFKRSLSSYSLTLMVINYLQCGCGRPVLPCLQTQSPEMFHELTDVHRISVVAPRPAWTSQNKMSVAELFTGFMAYYAFKFQYKECCVSVRLGRVIPKSTAKAYKSPTNCPGDWNFIAIEEPYERWNTAKSVWDPNIFNHILSVFKSSHAHLLNGYGFNELLQVKEWLPPPRPLARRESTPRHAIH